MDYRFLLNQRNRELRSQRARKIKIEDNIKPAILPSRIDIDKIDIDSLYHQALVFLESQKRDIPNLERKKEKIREKIRKSNGDKNLTGVQINSLIEELQRLTAQIEDLSDKDCRYQQQVSELVDRYNEMTPPTRRVVVGQKVDSIIETNPERDEIIQEFIGKFSNFLPEISFSRTVENFNGCYNCSSLEPPHYDEDGNKICPECFSQIDCLYNKVELIDKSDKKSSSSTDNQARFEKLLNSLTGECQIPENIIEYLDDYFENIKRSDLLSINIIDKPLSSEGTKEGTTIEQMLKAIKKLKLGYHEVHLICNRYWGWSLLELDPNDREKIIRDYQLSQSIFQSLTNSEREDRKSSLNTSFRCSRLLWKNGFLLPSWRFKMLKTEGSRESHNRVWKLICDRAIEMGHEDWSDLIEF